MHKLSVIITCFNHKAFLQEAIDSAIGQTYPIKEIILVDNASTDGSRELLKEIKNRNPEIELILPDEKLPYTAAFNKGFRKSSGDFIIDLSGDDILEPDFAEKAIEKAERLGKDYGVFYCNTEYINESGHHIKYHFGKDGRYDIRPPSGDLYAILLERHLISTPGMIFRRQVLEEMGGYDENLSYEDFDFWIRSSRKWKYDYLDFVGVKVRRHGQNLGSRFYEKNQNLMLWSTFKVCLKAKSLNRNSAENAALHKRASYHLRQAVFTEHFGIAGKFYALIKSVSRPGFADRFYYFLSLIQWPVYPFYKMFIRDH